MNIFEEIRRLKFPIGEYVVVGSGHIIALGLKEGKDIDIVVTQSLFNSCIKSDWEQIPWTYPEKIGHVFLRKGSVELYTDVNCGSFNPTTEELISRSTIIDDVPFASLEDILAFKKEYSKTKSKHLKDIQLIEDYINSTV